MSSTQDHATASKIRDAALALFGDQGIDATTVRQIAERAGVPVGLVNYHFGSKEGLRQDCDRWVMAKLREDKRLAMASSSMPQLQAFLADHPETQPILTYLVMCLRHGGEVATHVFDEMVQLTRELIDDGVAEGHMRAQRDPVASVALLVAYGCGASLLEEHVARHLGGTSLLDPPIYQRYASASLDLFTNGLFVDQRYLHRLSTDAEPPTS